MTITRDTTLSRSGDFLHAPVGSEEALMMSNATGRYYGLNAVGRRIWELIETPMTVGEVCARLCEEFEIDPPACEAAVLEFVSEMVANGMVHAG